MKFHSRLVILKEEIFPSFVAHTNTQFRDENFDRYQTNYVGDYGDNFAELKDQPREITRRLLVVFRNTN